MDANYSKTSIKNWAKDDRPRERLVHKGQRSLSNVELIAILLGSGNKNHSAVELARIVLQSVEENLINLSKLNINRLTSFPGIGEAKAVNILAALELGRRRRESEEATNSKISCSKDVFNHFHSELIDKLYEEFWILILSRSNSIIAKKNISEGGFNGTVADPKKIFKIALENNASNLILCHNHPSGNTQPSQSDIQLTRKLIEAGKNLDLPVLDHIIIGNDNYYSFADNDTL